MYLVLEYSSNGLSPPARMNVSLERDNKYMNYRYSSAMYLFIGNTWLYIDFMIFEISLQKAHVRNFEFPSGTFSVVCATVCYSVFMYAKTQTVLRPVQRLENICRKSIQSSIRALDS